MNGWVDCLLIILRCVDMGGLVSVFVIGLVVVVMVCVMLLFMFLVLFVVV